MNTKKKQSQKQSKKETAAAYLIGAAFLVLVILGIFWASSDGRNPVTVLKEKTEFTGSSEKGIYTELRYRVTLKNASFSGKEFTLNGVFEEGLFPVNETGMIGLDEESASSAFTLAGREEKTFSVLFVGTTAEKVPEGTLPIPEFTVTVLN
ncbi:MAG: hypothetical protein MJ070_09545 [Lachnospiraceae bacterium]|nr:hypothetical protein [Lachnospiraceae bacterium]